jgi:hypothetical protein
MEYQCMLMCYLTLTLQVTLLQAVLASHLKP